MLDRLTHRAHITLEHSKLVGDTVSLLLIDQHIIEEEAIAVGFSAVGE